MSDTSVRGPLTQYGKPRSTVRGKDIQAELKQFERKLMLEDYRQKAARIFIERRHAREHLADYLAYLNLGYQPAQHHRLLLDHLERLERREIKRLMVFFPPGSGKSFYGSMLFPAWYLGRNPSHNILAASHGAELAERFGRRVRNIFASDEQRQLFNVTISTESSAAGRWSTSGGGDYYAAGVGTGIAGFRGDICCIDDPIRNREDAESKVYRDKLWEWYKSDLFPRLKPDAVQVLIQTRWSTDDLAGRLIRDMQDGGQDWTILSLPMEARKNDPLGREIGQRLWPEWYTDSMVEQAKRDPRLWSSLYQQSPMTEGGHILKPQWWQRWPSDKAMPQAVHVIQSYDTAYSEQAQKTRSYSARSTWSVFKESDGTLAVMLSEAWRDHVDYPTLREQALKSYKEYRPDVVLIEKAASGQSLIQDMRRSGLPVKAYQPDKSKTSRAYAVQAMLEGGQVWAPRRLWADTFIDDVAQFPHGESDDYTDTMTQALLYVRNGLYLLGQPDPAPKIEEELEDAPPKRHAAYG